MGLDLPCCRRASSTTVSRACCCMQEGGKYYGDGLLPCFCCLGCCFCTALAHSRCLVAAILLIVANSLSLAGMRHCARSVLACGVPGHAEHNGLLMPNIAAGCHWGKTKTPMDERDPRSANAVVYSLSCVVWRLHYVATLSMAFIKLSAAGAARMRSTQ